MKILSVERILEQRLGLWLCIRFDEPVGEYNDEKEKELAKIVLDYVNSDGTFWIDNCLHHTNYFNEAIPVCDCPEYEGCKHWELDYDRLKELHDIPGIH